MSQPPLSRSDLRRQLRQKRRALSSAQQKQASESLCRHLKHLPQLRAARHIALYWPADGEIDPRPIARWAWQRGIRCYLPVLHPWSKRRLWFTAFTAKTRFRRNRFGIAEPIKVARAPLSPKHLDVVLLPLVGFDRSGGRLGMGGGFYDTTFAFRRHQPGWNRPKLLGVAHQIQEVEWLALQSWDVPVDGVVTDGGLVGGRGFRGCFKAP